MKRGLLLTLALVLVVNSGYAGAWRGQDNRMTFGDFMCGLVGGVALGAIANKAIGSDPLTLIAGILGGSAGVHFCQHLRDEEQQSLRHLVADASTPSVVGHWIQIQTDEFKGYVGYLAQGWRIGSHSNEVYKNECRYYEYSLYRRSSNVFLGRSFVWVCSEPDDSWVVTDGRWVTTDRPSSNRSRSENGRGGYGGSGSGSDYGSGSGSGSGSVSVGRGGSIPSIESSVVLNWDINQVPRKIKDGEYTRFVQVMNRKTEIGFLKGVSRDGQAVSMYVNGNDPQAIGEPSVSIDEVGVECGATPFCKIMDVVTADGIQGQMLYLFRNGDVGIASPQHGHVIRHVSTLKLAL